MTAPALRLSHDGSPLSGAVELDGGKHAFAHVIASAAVADAGTLDHVPDNIDSRALIDALGLLFADVEFDVPAGKLRFGRPLGKEVVFGSELLARSRSLFGLLPAALHHAGRVVLHGLPQGCEIGARPYEWYLRSLGDFGATFRDEGDRIIAEWRRRRPAEIRFAYPTMTGTVICVAAAYATDGRSTITGASVEPSCHEQVEAMARNGVKAAHEGSRIEIQGGAATDFSWELCADRIHAVTLLTAGLLSRGDVTVRFNRDLRVPRFVEFCREIGAHVDTGPHHIRVRHPVDRPLGPARVQAGSEPFFSSDWAPFAALLLAARSEGESSVSDDVFPRRFQYVESLRPAGLTNVEVSSGRRGRRTTVEARVHGDPHTRLKAMDFAHCPDIRGSAALVLAALVADGECSIPDDFHLRRGYGDLPRQLTHLGLRPGVPVTGGNT